MGAESWTSAGARVRSRVASRTRGGRRAFGGGVVDDVTQCGQFTYERDGTQAGQSPVEALPAALSLAI
jgi:hypothetical protein